MDKADTVVKKGLTTILLTGNPVNLISTRYDMAAPRVQLEMKNNRAETGIASGGARIVLRELEQKRETILTCSTATYRGATPGKPARIDLAGPVKSNSKDPQLNPLDATFESGYIEFVDAETTRIHMDKPIISGTAIEKPQDAPKTPNKKP
jgi:hypothetical protein